MHLGGGTGPERGVVITYALRRMLGAIPVLLLSTFLMFWLVSSVNDPIAELKITCPNCSPSAYERLNDLYNLDQPIPQRYLSWVGDVATGDLGISTSMGETPVSDIFWERVRNTMLISLPAAIIVIVFSALLSIYAALKQYSFGDYALSGFTYLGLAMPTFFFALLLQVFFTNLSWWPAWTGTKPFWSGGLHLESFGQFLSSATLPIVTLVIVSLASDTRFGRTAMLETRNSDFIRTARAKGVPERTIVLRHMLRAALIPMVTVWALTFGALLGGTVVTESVFAWPGVGRLLIAAAFDADVNVLMAGVLFIGVLAMLFNLLADLIYGWLDPRVRYD